MDQRRQRHKRSERWQRTWVDDDGETQIEVMAPGYCPGCSLGCICGKQEEQENRVTQVFNSAVRKLVKNELTKTKTAKMGSGASGRTAVLTQSRKTNRKLATVIEDEYLSSGSDDEVSMVWEKPKKDLGARLSNKQEDYTIYRRRKLEAKFACQFCNRKPYKIQNALMRHLETKHLEEMTRTKQVGIPSPLAGHGQATRRFSDADLEIVQFPCKTCGRKFYDKRDLMKHQESHVKMSVTKSVPPEDPVPEVTSPGQDSGNSSASSGLPTSERGSDESFSMDMTTCREQSFNTSVSTFLRNGDRADDSSANPKESQIPLRSDRDDSYSVGNGEELRGQSQGSASAIDRPVARMSMSAFMSFKASPVHVNEDQDLLSFFDSPSASNAVSSGVCKVDETAANESTSAEVSFLGESTAVDEKDATILPQHSSTMLEYSGPRSGIILDDLSCLENSFADVDLTVKRNIRFSTIPTTETEEDTDETPEDLQTNPTVLYLGRRSILDTHPYECKVLGCGGRFESSKVLNNHVELHRTHGGKFQCPKCNREFEDVHKFREHSRSASVSGCSDDDDIELNFTD